MKRLLPQAMVLLVAIEHLYILVLEMFFWNRPLGLRTFNLTQELADATTTLAANQGLYNGFLAAGLLWGLSLGADGRDIKIFFLACVLVAGLYGAATVGKKILFVQGIPAALAIVLVWLAA